MAESGGNDEEVFDGLGVPAALRAQLKGNAEIEVWQENYPAVQIFLSLLTQWRVGMGGREGLIYGEVWKLFDEWGIRKKKRRLALFEDIQAMETEILGVWAKQRKKPGS